MNPNNLRVSRVSLPELMEYVEKLFDRAERYYIRALNGDHNAYAQYHAFYTKALEYDYYVEAMAQGAVMNTMGSAPSLTNRRFFALNPANVAKDIEEEKDKPSVEDATIIDVKKDEKEAEKINKNIIENIQDFELEILTSKHEKNKEEEPGVKIARSMMCKAIASGERSELARFLSEFKFADKDYSYGRAMQFINAVKAQFNVPEPGKKLKSWPSEQLPKGRFIYAKYIQQGPSQNIRREGYIKRHKHREEMVDASNEFVCHLNDVESWRHIFPSEKDEAKKPAPF